MSALIVDAFWFDLAADTHRYGTAHIHGDMPMSPIAPRLPFSVSEGIPGAGVWRARRGLTPMFVCGSPLHVLALTRDQGGWNGALLGWPGDDGAPRRAVVGVGAAYDSQRIRIWLESLGLSVPRGGQYLSRYILDCLYGADDVDSDGLLPTVNIEVRTARETVWSN